MRNHKHTLFRRSAWAAYIGRYEQTVLPRFVTPPVFLFFWIFSGFLLSAGSTAWFLEIPTYATGSGVLLEQPVSPSSGAREMMALVFLPANRPLTIQKGTSVQLQVSEIGVKGSGQVERVEPGLMTPQDVRKRYILNGVSASLMTGPAVVVLVKVEPPLSDSIYVESIVNAQVPIGTQRLLTLLFGQRD